MTTSSVMPSFSISLPPRRLAHLKNRPRFPGEHDVPAVPGDSLHLVAGSKRPEHHRGPAAVGELLINAERLRRADGEEPSVTGEGRAGRGSGETLQAADFFGQRRLQDR